MLLCALVRLAQDAMLLQELGLPLADDAVFSELAGTVDDYGEMPKYDDDDEGAEQ